MTGMHRFLLLTSVSLSCVLVLAPVVGADSLQWNAAALMEHCVTSGVHLVSDAGAIELIADTLIEDDGPAAGYSYRPNVETLTAAKRLKKLLLVDRPRARRATLLIARGGDLELQLNGKRLEVRGPHMVGQYWQAYDFDPQLLRGGENEVVIAGRGLVWIARDDEYAAGSLTRTSHPNRSARSLDGGKTWSDQRLGDGGNVDGEYYVRLWLDQSAPRGTLRTPVLDAANLQGRSIGPPLKTLGGVGIRLDLAGTPEGAHCDLRLRSGPTAVPDERNWSTWIPIEQPAPARARVSELSGRFFQWELTLHTDDPLSSPRLRSLQIDTEAEPMADAWTSRLKLVAEDNRPLVRSSIPFLHEDSRHPLLEQLRRDYQLDDVVGRSETEFELITRLAAWSSQRWSKLGHLNEAYPPWNALEILKPHADGTPVGGFCQQYNLVFLQACQSFGIAGRVVSIGSGKLTDRIRSGHEAVEVWSNDYGKWVYVDGNAAWYIADGLSGVPLSLWELRQEQLAAFAQHPRRALRLVRLAETRSEWKGIDAWPPFVELRLVPRSDFLSRAAPLPLNQGMRGWFWTGYEVWSDERMPAGPIYPRRVVARGNFEWTAAGVQLRLEATPEPGALRVHADVEMPNLDALLAAFDGGAAEPVGTSFAWKLHPGCNRLAVAARNDRGRESRRSVIELDFRGERQR